MLHPTENEIHVLHIHCPRYTKRTNEYYIKLQFCCSEDSFKGQIEKIENAARNALLQNIELMSETTVHH